MCLLILKPAGQSVPADLLERASFIHQDGFGFAIAHGNYFETHHTLDWTPELIDRLEDAHDKDVLIHYRMATHGSVTLANVHPFRMPVDTYNDVYVAHNGILMDHQPSKHDLTDRSDTRLFIDNVLTKLQSGWWNDEVIVRVLEDEIGYSKMVLLWPNGGALILNETYGHWKDGVWYSNETAFPSTKPKAQPAITASTAQPSTQAFTGNGMFAEDAAYLDNVTKEVWCYTCGAGCTEELEVVKYGRMIHDPYFKTYHPKCACCEKPLLSQFWLHSKYVTNDNAATKVH